MRSAMALENVALFHAMNLTFRDRSHYQKVIMSVQYKQISQI